RASLPCRPRRRPGRGREDPGHSAFRSGRQGALAPAGPRLAAGGPGGLRAMSQERRPAGPSPGAATAGTLATRPAAGRPARRDGPEESTGRGAGSVSEALGPGPGRAPRRPGKAEVGISGRERAAEACSSPVLAYATDERDRGLSRRCFASVGPFDAPAKPLD